MSITPRRPVSPATGRWRYWLAVMILAASWRLVVVVTAGRVVIAAWTRASLRSFPAAMARVMSAWVMMPASWPVCASTTMRAVVPVCFIRYAAAARWSYCPAVVRGDRITSVTAAVAAGGRSGGVGAGAAVVVWFMAGLLACWVAIMGVLGGCGRGRQAAGRVLAGCWRGFPAGVLVGAGGRPVAARARWRWTRGMVAAPSPT